MSVDDQSPLDRLKSDFVAKVSGDLAFVEREVNGEPMRFYHRPITMADAATIRRVSENEGAMAGIVMSFILRCRNEDGSRMFSPKHKTALMREVDSDLISDVVIEMGRASDPLDNVPEDLDPKKPAPPSLPRDDSSS